jgi:hypothetical protein
MKAKRERASEDDSDDRRLKPGHMFRDIGPAVEEADYRPRTYGIPEQTLAAAFIAKKRDYGGPLPADLVTLHAALQGAGCAP